jgi:Icc protein
MMATNDSDRSFTHMLNSRPIKLLQITDTHLLGTRDGLMRGVATYATLQAVQRHAQQRFANPDGVLLTGDLVQDDANGYALIREAFASSPVPVYCIPGNHDLPHAMHTALNARPFVLNDHVVLGNWLVILLNSWQENNASGRLGDLQLQRLEQLLDTHAGKHALICLHHHPIAMQSQWLDQVGLQDAQRFQSCLNKHSQVRGVLWGHVHQELDTIRDGIRYLATPATCSQFLPGSDEFALDNRPPGYRTLELNSDGSINTEVIWLS